MTNALRPPASSLKVPTNHPTPSAAAAASERNLVALVLHGIGDAQDLALESRLTPEDFEEPSSRILFGVFRELHRKGHPINQHTAEAAARTLGISPSVIEEFQDVVFSDTARFDLQQIGHAALLRRVRRECGAVAQEAAGRVDDVDAFRDRAQSRLFSIFDSCENGTESTARQLADRFVDQFLQPLKQGVPTGFADLDHLTMGWQPGDMIVLAARPSMGKTALALNFTYHALRAEMKRAAPERGHVHFFSLEMKGEQLMQRLVALHGKIAMDHLRAGLAEKRAVERASREIGELPLIIDDASDLSIHDLRGRARRVHRKNRVRLLVVDYMQLISPSDPKLPREQQVSEFSRGLKGLAKELGVPVIVLSQLNRAPVTENRAPRLSDLRESGSIEQDADLVLLLGPDPKIPPGEQGVASSSIAAELAKQRNGPTGSITLNFEKAYGRFLQEVARGR